MILRNFRIQSEGKKKNEKKGGKEESPPPSLSVEKIRDSFPSSQDISNKIAEQVSAYFKYGHNMWEGDL